MNLLAVHDLTVRFGGLVALDDVSLSVRRGEVVGVIGPNGAGKSTLFEAVCGRARLAGGSILFDGHDVTRWPAHRRARAGIGRTFQEGRLFEELNALDHLAVSTAWQRRAWSRHLLPLLDRFEIPPDVAVSQLPLAGRRIVNVARALALEPRLLLLDEPAAGLNEEETVEMAETIWALKEEGDLSVLLVEHDVEMVLALCDYVYVLDTGVVISEGPPHVVRTDERVVEAYLGTATSA